MTRVFHNPHEDHTVPTSTTATRPEVVRKASLQLAAHAADRAELAEWLDMLGLPPFDGRPVRLRDRYLYGKGRTSS